MFLLKFQRDMPKSSPNYLSMPYKYYHFLCVDNVKNDWGEWMWVTPSFVVVQDQLKTISKEILQNDRQFHYKINCNV